MQAMATFFVHQCKKTFATQSSNTGHINAEQQNAALCQEGRYAPQQQHLLFDQLVGEA